MHIQNIILSFFDVITASPNKEGTCSVMHNSIPATVALSDGTLLLLLNYYAFIFITGNRI